MKKTALTGAAILALLALSPGCKKDPGKGGKAHIHGHVEHEASGTKAAGVTVSIWYGKSSADGDADDNTTTEGMVCMSMGATDGDYEFENLQKGDYYVQCMIAADTCLEGTDSIPVMLMGGKAVTIDEKTGEFDGDIHIE